MGVKRIRWKSGWLSSANSVVPLAFAHEFGAMSDDSFTTMIKSVAVLDLVKVKAKPGNIASMATPG